MFCKNENHGVAKCSTFAAKSAEKKAFILENHLSFFLLKKGPYYQSVKDDTSVTRGQRHPTSLHIEKNMKPGETTSKGYLITGENPGEETLNVMTHALTRHVSTTSCVIPVLVSSAIKPQREILTYALLDTQ